MTIDFRDYRPLALAQMNREHEEFANLLNEADADGARRAAVFTPRV